MSDDDLCFLVIDSSFSIKGISDDSLVKQEKKKNNIPEKCYLLLGNKNICVNCLLKEQKKFISKEGDRIDISDQIQICINNNNCTYNKDNENQALDFLNKESFNHFFENLLEGYAYHKIITNDEGIPVDYIFLEINSAFENLTGLKRNIINKTVRNVIPNIEDSWIEKYGKVALGVSEPLEFEQHTEAIGKTYRVKVYSPQKGYFITVFEDITEKINNENKIIEKDKSLEKQNQEYAAINEEYLTINEEYKTINEELNDTKKYLEEIIRIAPAVIGIAKKGKIEYLNDLIYEYTGYKKEELAGKPVKMLFANIEDYNKAKENDIVNLETAWNTKKGEKIEVLFNTKNINSINGDTIFAALDISEIRKAEEKIIKARDYYIEILEKFPLLIWKSGTDMLCNYFNNTWLEFTGRTIEQEMGNGWSEGVHPDDLETCLKIYTESFKKHESFFMEYRLKDVSGEYRYIADYGRPIYDLEENFSGYIGACYDVQDRRVFENELIKEKQRAEESDKLKTAFLANMSHEIRTPMNGIIGFSELLKDVVSGSEEYNRYIDIIQTNANQLLTLINDIIDISKIESKALVTKDIEFNLNVLLDRIYSLFNNELKIKSKEQVKLICNKEAKKNIFIIFDEVRLNQLLGNLLSNAVKFTNEGSIEFGYKLEKKEILFYVKDTGKGIEEDKLDLIFERFRQEDDSIMKFHGGSGLGLAICRGILELYNTKIWAESKIGEGSTFYFTIPYKKGVTTTDDFNETELMETKNNLNGKTILIVEDEHYSYEYLVELLKDSLATILYAQNGIDAIKICEKQKNIDLIFMDIRLPGMNGFEVTKAIRKSNNKVKIIAQTAYAMPEDRDKCLSAGCDDYISKPIESEKLFNIINKHFAIG